MKKGAKEDFPAAGSGHAFQAASGQPAQPSGQKRKFPVWGIVLIVLGVLVLIPFILIVLVVILAVALSGASSGLEVEGYGNTAIIPIRGEITTGASESIFGGSSASSDDIMELIQEADESPLVEAIIFEIDSPGGSPVASEEISSAIKKLDKPKVAWIRETGASGAYWVASSTDYIIASRMSMTGSIGVFGSYLQIGGFLNKQNVTYERLVSGEHKDSGTPYRPLQQDEREKLQKQLDLIHGEFISAVAENRNMQREKVAELATGDAYLGSEALELGLIDAIGSRDEAVSYVEGRIGKKATLSVYKKRKSFLDRFAETTNEKFYYIGRGIGSSLVADSSDYRIRT